MVLVISVIDVMEKYCWQFSHHLLSNSLLGKIERDDALIFIFLFFFKI